MEELVGKLKVVLFHNNENLYSVIKIKLDDYDDNAYMTVVGNFPIPNATNNYKYIGEYINHPKFGMQFSVNSYEELLPSSKEETLKYLSSPLFKGIGKKIASKIVDYLGEDAINKIKEDPYILDNIVSLKQKNIILEQILNEDYFNEAVKLFFNNGLTMKNLLKIRSVYQDKMVEVIKENPYRLVEEIDGISFKIADTLALNLGFDLLSKERIMGAILYSINYASYEKSSTFVSYLDIRKYFNKVIYDIDDESFDYFLSLLIKEGKIYKDNDDYYPYKQYAAEDLNARVISKFISRFINNIDDNEIDKYIYKIEKELNISYDIEQKNAIKNCLNNGISIITGGPGTGKTTIINALIKVYSLIYPSHSIMLAAPTGRASKRLTSLTNMKASTIHSHLKWDLHSNTFSVNKDNPLNVDLIIVDEFSMVDNILLSKLLEASSNVSQILFVGDDDQLPSVSPGNVLKDLIDTGYVNVIKLNKIHRQSNDSNIIKLAHHIKLNEEVSDDFSNDVSFYKCNDMDIKKITLEYIKKAINNGYSEQDILVLVPMYSGANGIDNFNVMLQAYFNPPSNEKKEVKFGSVIYREKDKILQLKNQNDDGVYNGDIGELVEIVYEDNSYKLIIDFDGILVEYSKQDLINIRHAYCISVHKSQGNEYPVIIAPFSYAYQRMLAKNLIYTAITRAKKKLVLLGDYEAFNYGINNKKYQKRYTKLKERIINILDR